MRIELPTSGKKGTRPPDGQNPSNHLSPHTSHLTPHLSFCICLPSSLFAPVCTWLLQFLSSAFAFVALHSLRHLYSLTWLRLWCRSNTISLEAKIFPKFLSLPLVYCCCFIKFSRWFACLVVAAAAVVLVVVVNCLLEEKRKFFHTLMSNRKCKCSSSSNILRVVSISSTSQSFQQCSQPSIN